MRLSQSFGLAMPLTYPVKVLIFTVLYGHRFFLHPLAFFTRINYNAGGRGKGESRKKKKAPTS